MRCTWKLGLVCALWLGVAPLGGRAQSGQSGVILEANETVFSVLAALNAAGYDAGLGSSAGSEARLQLRATLAQRELPVLAELRRFYEEHRVAGDSGTDLGQYVSLALLTGAAPDFALAVPENNLPPDAKALVGLLPLLRTFTKQANLLGLWTELQPYVRREIERYSDPVRRQISRADAYFRFPSGAYLGRTYSIYLDLLAAPEQVHARIYGLNYYLVVTPAREPKLYEIRHQYLHFLLDPLAVKYASEIQKVSVLLPIARTAPRLGRDFKADFSLLVTECLIRAAELRMDKLPKDEAGEAVAKLAASGLVLAPYFYTALAEFEQQEVAMNLYYREMIQKIDVEAEKKRLARVQFLPPETPAPEAAKPAVSEEERLLDQGDNLFYQGKYLEAKAAYQAVLEKLNAASERALYGMAVVAANTRKPNLAEAYFKKTLEVGRDMRLATWCRIYLGRLYDLNGRREDALAQYRAASLTASGYPEAQRAVERALQKPFGSEP
jgi:tetratricopeptide (TPR) repeat protein